MTPSRAPAPSPLALGISAGLRGQRGIALVEMLLVMGVVAVATPGVVSSYRYVDNARKVQREVENAGEIANNMIAATVTEGDFAFINQSNAMLRGVFPPDMIDANGVPRNAWGGEVLVTAADLDGKTNWGAVTTFTDVPASACSKLATQAAPGFYGVRVNDEVVKTAYGAMDVAYLTQLCARDRSSVQLVYAKHGGAGEGFDLGAPCVVDPPEAHSVVDAACPTGQVGTVVYRTDHKCFSPYGPSSDLPGVVISNICAPVCVLPTPQSQYENETRTGNQLLLCPTGQLGGIEQARPEQRTRERTAFCEPSPGYSQPVGAYQWSAWSEWSEWTATGGWTTTSDTCAPECVAPAPTTAPASRTESCPTGQVTSSGSSSFTQTTTKTTTYSCPAPTGTYTTNPATYGSWEPLASSVCAPACVAPSPTTRTVEQPGYCSPGTVTPGGAQSFTQTATETTTYSCPSPQGAYTSAPATLSPWTPTSQEACATQCVAPPSVIQTQAAGSETQTLYCPAGQYGQITQSRAQSQDRTISYSCPAPTGAYTTQTGAWGAPYATPPGVWGTTGNTCTACPAPVSESATQWVLLSNTCPSGMEGTYRSEREQRRTRTNSYNCPAGTTTLPAITPGTWSSWTNTGATRVVTNTCTPSCTPYTYTSPKQDSKWVYEELGCPAGQLGSNGRGRNEYRDAYYSYSCETGGSTLTGWSGWYSFDAYSTSNTCHLPRSCTTNTFRRFWEGGVCSGTVPSGQTVGHGASIRYPASINPNTGSGGTGYADYMCNDGTLATSSHNWVCNPPAPAGSCVVSAGTPRSWTKNGLTCNGMLNGGVAGTFANGASVYASAGGYPSGTAYFTCSNGTVSTTASSASCVDF